ncbi:hypothetical protein HY041_00800 [Candidatus Roizmanbacteria bacterium]|nr:hypothetical protein [Candidatus Roizmanbacteria bacterium]
MKTLFFTIAGVVIKLNFHPAEGKFFSEKLKSDIIQHYKPFIKKKNKGKVDYTVHFYQKNTREISTKKIGKAVVFLMDFCQVKGKKTILSDYKISLSQFQYILLNMLQKYFMEHNGFILHSSGNIYHKRAVLFLGKPGAGKSTAMGVLAERYISIADDSLIIKKEGKIFICYQTPLIETNYWVKKKAAHFPIGGVFFLKKSSRYEIKEITDKNYIINRISKQIWVGGGLTSRQMKYVLKFIKINKFYFLYFGKNKKKLWSLFKHKLS